MIRLTKPKAPLLIFSIALAVTTANTAFTAEFAILTQQSLERADVTTHEISSGGVILGISEFGGGYINKLFIPGVGDFVAKEAAHYGRGGQVSIRDSLHGGRYNPTQGGFTDPAGTNCVIERPANGLLVMPPRPVALWNGDGKYDFTEWENLAADPYRHDGGNSDQDGIDESNLIGKQATEIISEFDLTASYKDIRDGQSIVIPAFQFRYEFRFIREPGHALKQFRKGTPAYNGSAAIDDRSNLAPPGKHPSTEDSLTDVILSCALRGDKIVWNPEVVFLSDNAGKITSTQPKGALHHPFFEKTQLLEHPLVILSKSTNPNQGPAIGFYHPNSQMNRFAIVGRSLKDGSISYEDNRQIRGVLLGNFTRTEKLWLFGVRTFHAGLLNRKETPEGVYECIRGESYILVGTPNEIFEAARAIQRLP